MPGGTMALVRPARDPDAMRSGEVIVMTSHPAYERRQQLRLDRHRRQRDLVRASLVAVRTSRPTHRRWAA
jgi:hypothetical protein